jgi:preprotein translocase subunit SecG
MIILLLVVHILVAISLVGVILLQKSEGGALGMGGGGMSGFMTGRSTANLLTRTTAILALLFMLTSLSLVWFSNRGHAPRSIIDQGAPPAPTAPDAPTAPPPGAPPAEPPQPSPPLAR